MSALTRHLALVSESSRVGIGDVMKVAAALQKQAIRDLAPIWEISATVDAFERLEDVPLGYWPMIVRDDINQAGAAGIHLDRDRQPFALITAADDLNAWSLTASHEALEMLVDPFGDRLVAGDSPAQGQSRVRFLVEVCDPSEAAEFGYPVNEILVSDFYTPKYFDPVQASGVRYSFTGAVTQPRQVLRGGYLSWHEPASDHWFQLIYFGGAARVRDIGKLDGSTSSLRSQIDRVTEEERAKANGPQTVQAFARSGRAALLGSVVGDGAGGWSSRLRSQVQNLVAGKADAGASLKRRSVGTPRPAASDGTDRELKSGPKFRIDS